MFEIVESAFKTQGYDLEDKVFPWARALNRVKEADYDVLLATWYTEVRNESLLSRCSSGKLNLLGIYLRSN